jgi:hypothetical protein
MFAGPADPEPIRAEFTSGASTGARVAGRLRAHAAFWRMICVSTVVLSWVVDGYPIPWYAAPPAPMSFENKGMTEEYSRFVDGAVADLVVSGGASEWATRPTVVSAISVVPKAYSDKLRLIIDLRYVNTHIDTVPFKYEGLQFVRDLIREGDYMFSIDIASAYHHVLIRESDRQYLGFQWRGRFYVFNSLPFGLSTACQVFTKIMREMVGYWRSYGIRVLPYLDDAGFFVHPAMHRRTIDFVLKTYELAGWVLQPKKLQGVAGPPLTRMKLLGFILDSDQMLAEVPEDRWTGFQQTIADLLQCKRGHTPVRLLARFAGQAQSMGFAIGVIARMFTIFSYALIDTRRSWYTHLTLSPEVTTELTFFKAAHRAEFTSSFRCPTLRPALTIWTDASDFAWGGHTNDPNGHVAQGYLTPAERLESSTFRELRAILYVLQAFEHLFRRGETVVVFTDSKSSMWILNKGGSAKEHLHAVALQVFRFAMAKGIRLVAIFIPRTQNERADEISKWWDKDDWQIHPVLFNALSALWGLHTFDRFGSHLNSLCPSFNSYFWCPRTAGVDAFTFDWAGLNNWINPPFRLISTVLRHLHACAATATLIVPAWTKQHWWSTLCPDGRHFRSFVTDWVSLGDIADAAGIPRRSMFLPGAARGNGQGIRPPAYALFALRVSFAADAVARCISRCTVGGCPTCSWGAHSFPVG